MSIRSLRARHFVALAASVGSLVATPRDANAHFALREPACYSEMDVFGSPQKSPPCGQADPGATAVPTGAVTAYVSGGMLTLTIDETIFHPGHYRIAIANDMASLPADPPVTATSSTPCGTTVIDPAPALPLLADGVFVHTTAFSGPQTMQIPLPAGFTCDHCVLQVVEFMSNHGLNNPGGCFYHHCAIVNVGAGDTDGGTSDASSMDVTLPTDSGSAETGRVGDTGSTAADAGAHDAGPSTMTNSGCGCRTTSPAARNSSLAAFGLAMAGFLARRRRVRR
jgi:MYXO-CTERM domain-containing protein